MFLGRIEPCKGLHLFCDAIDRLRAKLPPGLRIAFLGKSDPAWPRELIEKRMAHWGREVAFLSDPDTFGANGYLRGTGRLAVLPSLSGNSP